MRKLWVLGERIFLSSRVPALAQAVQPLHHQHHPEGHLRRAGGRGGVQVPAGDREGALPPARRVLQVLP